MSRFSRLPAALALLCLAATAAPAFADETDTSAMTVNTSDLDLTTSAGVTALHKRIYAAASHVCRATSFGDNFAFEACRTETLQDALPRMRQLVAAENERIRMARASQTVTAANQP
jgi:UrcA family protein